MSSNNLRSDKATSAFSNGFNGNLSKRVDRTIKISNITHGMPLRRPKIRNLDESTVSAVTTSVQKETSLSEENWDSVTPSGSDTHLLNGCIPKTKTKIEINDSFSGEETLKPGLKTTLLDKYIIKKDYRDFNKSNKNNNNNNSYSSEKFYSHSYKSSPREQKQCRRSVKERISFPEKTLESSSSKSKVPLDYDHLMDGNEDVDPEFAASCDVSESTVRFLQKQLYAKMEFEFIGNEEVFFDHPIGVAQLKSKDIVVADTFSDRMHLFSEEGKFLRHFGNLNILKQPSAIAVLPDGRFAVRNSRSIAIFSADCQHVLSFGSDFLTKPFGITDDGQGNIYTIDTGFNQKMAIVKIDASTGNVCKKIPVTNLVPPSLLLMSKPRFIAFRPPSILHVVDLGLNKVYIINVNTGRVLQSFGRSGDGEGEFNDPSGIAIDADGFIIVGDSRNHRIQMFTPNGKFVSVLRMDRPLRRPSGICLTNDGSLLVLNYWENSLVKYKFMVKSM